MKPYYLNINILVIVSLFYMHSCKNLFESFKSSRALNLNNQIQSNANETVSLKEIIEKQKQEINDLKINIKILHEESQNKTSLSLNKQSNNDDFTSYLKQMLESQNLYRQIDLQIAREKELRESVENKMKLLETSERKIERLFEEINFSFKNKLDEVAKQTELNKKSSEEISQRVFALEKEKEKVQMTRNLIKKGFEDNLIEPDCVNRNSCRICLEDPKCVWCSIERKCKIGDMSGPYDGSCLNSFEYSSCSSACIKYSTCSECISDPSCGWCGDSNKCLEGSAVSPIGSLCSNSYIHSENMKRCPSFFRIYK